MAVTLGGILVKLFLKSVGLDLSATNVMEKLFERQLTLRTMLADAGLPQLEEVIFKNADDLRSAFELPKDTSMGQIYEMLTARYAPKDLVRAMTQWQEEKPTEDDYVDYKKAAPQWVGTSVKWEELPSDIRKSASDTSKKKKGYWYYFFYYDNAANFDFVKAERIIRRLGQGEAAYPKRCREFLKRIWNIGTKKDTQTGEWLFWNKWRVDYKTKDETAEEARKRMYGRETEADQTARIRAKLLGGTGNASGKKGGNT